MIRKLFHFGFNLGISPTARHVYWVFSGNVLSTILTFFTLVILIAPKISKSDYGIFLALFTLASLLSDLGEAGFGGALTKFIPPLILKGKSVHIKSYLSSAYRIEFIISVFIGMIVLFFAKQLAQLLFAGTQPANLIVTAILTSLMVFLTFATFALSAQKKFPEMTVVSVFYSLIRLLFLILAIHFFQINVFIILVVYTLATFFSWGYTFVFLGVNFLKLPFDIDKARELGAFAVFLALQKILVSISSRLDLLMLVPLAGAIEAGVYGMASRFSLVYPLLVSSLGQVLSPKFAEFQGGKEVAAFFKKTVILVLGLLISLIIFYYFASFFIHLFVIDYLEAIPVLKGLLIALVPFIIATPFVSLLTYTFKKPYLISVATFVQLIVILASNLYFLPRLGRFAPAIGIGMGNLAVCIIAICASWYHMRKTS